jgi:hypothetical protein
MRLLIASMAALAAVAFAAPSYAQTPEETSPAPAPVPTAKPKAGTAAYCQSLKTSSSRSACLKKVSATKTTKATATAKKTKKTTTPAAPKQPDVGQLSAPPAAAPAAATPSGTVVVPPLPQKTI